MGILTTLRRITRRLLISVLGTEIRPRRILRGLASGCQIVVSPAEHLSYLFGTAETHLQKAIKKYVHAGDTVFDIGANIGYVSLSLARQVGGTGQVFAFEPLPENIELFRKAKDLNPELRITLFEIAASNASGTATIRTTDNHSMASLVWHAENTLAQGFVVKTEPIDELVSSGKVAIPSFVKVDVEGAEGFVISGMRRMLSIGSPVIFIECSDAGRETTWATLRELGYRCRSAVSQQATEKFEQYRHGDFLWIREKRA